jgi:hypothetical protein
MKQKSAKLYQFPRHARTASIPIVDSEDAFYAKKGSVKKKSTFLERGFDYTLEGCYG